MRQLRSTWEDLRLIFEDHLTVALVSEDLLTFDELEVWSEVKQQLEQHDFDEAGVTRDGHVVGYIKREDLVGGVCSQHLRAFQGNELMADSTPLLVAMERIVADGRRFIVRGDGQFSIVTMGDLQKAPVRILLSGIVMLLEMQMLRLIRAYYRGEDWKEQISRRRLDKAEREFAKRKGRNEETDLADYLQFCDKRDLLLKMVGVTEWFDMGKGGVSKMLKSVEKIRDDVAHGADLVAERSWEELLEVAGLARSALTKLESVSLHATDEV